MTVLKEAVRLGRRTLGDRRTYEERKRTFDQKFWPVHVKGEMKVNRVDRLLESVFKYCMAAVTAFVKNVLMGSDQTCVQTQQTEFG